MARFDLYANWEEIAIGIAHVVVSAVPVDAGRAIVRQQSTTPREAPAVQAALLAVLKAELAAAGHEIASVTE